MQAPIAEIREAENIPTDQGAQSASAGSTDDDEPVSPLLTRARTVKPTSSSESASLSELYGYVQHSDSNTLALVRKVSALALHLETTAIPKLFTMTPNAS